MLFLSQNRPSSSSSSSRASNSKGNGDPIELAKEWKRNLQKEVRTLDRDIANIRRQEDKAMKECRALVKANRASAAKILAKEVANTRKTIMRMHVAKAQLNSVSMTLQTSIAMLKMQGCLSKSTEIMTAMNKLVNVKEIRETMQTMAREMEKSGLVDEIIGETFDSMEADGIESAADLEVDRIMTEITAGVLAPAAAAPSTAVKGPATATAAGAVGKMPAAAEEQQEDAEDASTQALLSRLHAL
eukprot:gene33262-43006_t